MLRLLMYNIAPAVLSYFFYNLQFFLFADGVFQRRKKTVSIYIITFVINYSIFFAVSILGFHLIVNWTIFLLVVFLEILIIYRCSRLNSLFMTFICTLPGLALNIFFRCGIAIVINVPLAFFDNNVSDPHNLKKYPLLLCFSLTGVIFWCMRKKGYADKLRQYIDESSGLGFYALILVILYTFLTLNLLAYYTPGNNLFIKLWGVKSVILVSFVLFIGYQYTVRLNQFKQHHVRFAQAQWDLLDKKKEEEKISLLAFTDPLTGFYNRQYAEERFKIFAQENDPYVICFADLDGLKVVNDQMGHAMGDIYLIKAAELIRKSFCQERNSFVRFGGDEFLIIVKGASVKTAEDSIAAAAEELREAGRIEGCKFSISYGLADGEEADGIRGVVQLADQRMYQCKQKNRLR